MRILLTPIGSHGDVHPFVGLGKELVERGHEVILITNDYFRSLVEKEGLAFLPLHSAEEYLQALANPDVWHPKKGTKLVFHELANKLIRPLYQLVEENWKRGETILVSPPIALGARIAHEKLGIPLATIHFAPIGIRSLISPSELPGIIMPPWLPIWFKKALFWFGDYYVVDPVVAKPLNQFRKELGLSPVNRVIKDWWHSPQLILGLFPEWFAPKPKDWPEQVHLTSFPLYDETELCPISPELEEFLKAGEPPILFTPGSANLHAKTFFSAAAEACKLLNRRGVFLTRFEDNLPSPLPRTIKCFSYIPFSQVFPRCAVVVHHGGIGTTSQALAAGVPQLIMPMAHDQPDNAGRVQNLKVGLRLKPSNFIPAQLAESLRQLLAEKYQTRAREVASWLHGRDGIKESCDLLETMDTMPNEQVAIGG